MKFEKISKEQWIKDVNKLFANDEAFIKKIENNYDDIQLPVRSTSGSAGYDFSLPFDIYRMTRDSEIIIPTGIKCELDKDKVLNIYPRSSIGFKYHIRLANTVGIIDSDYYNNKNNEGHIMIKMINNGHGVDLFLHTGEKFAQGVIQKYYTVDDDNVTTERVGGIGSTNK